MIEFNLTNEQKKVIYNNAIAGLESSLYQLLVSIGKDPEDEAIDFSDFSSAQQPSNEYIIHQSYTRYLALKEKLSSL